MPCCVTEPAKACEGLTEEFGEGVGRDFAIELSTDKQTRYNLDLREGLEERGGFRKGGVDGQCPHYSLF